jgi:hypothetical protein
MDALRSSRFTCRRLDAVVLGLMLACLASGCVSPRGQSVVGRPVKHTARTERVIVHSDVPINDNSPLLRELAELRLDVLSTLALPDSKRPVVVYLFGDEDRYTSYMHQHFPKLPSRRAFFIGSTTELAVYAFHGKHLATDLRHEYTHGVLHSSLRHVPLWLDEGLAEFFEPTRSKDHVNDEHLERLAAAVQGGWQPNLERLEQLSDVSEMQALDYHEAWAWVYSYLKAEQESDRQKLVSYIHTLRDSQPAKKLSQVLGPAKDEGSRMLLRQIAELSPGTSSLDGDVQQASFADAIEAARAKVEQAQGTQP